MRLIYLIGLVMLISCKANQAIDVCTKVNNECFGEFKLPVQQDEINKVQLNLQQDETTDLITNGDFSSGANWTTGAGWAIAAGKATATNITAAGTLTQTLALEPLTYYKLTFTIENMSASSQAGVNVGGNLVGIFQFDGTYEFYFHTDAVIAANEIEFLGSVTLPSFDLDNVSLFRMGTVGVKYFACSYQFGIVD